MGLKSTFTIWILCSKVTPEYSFPFIFYYLRRIVSQIYTVDLFMVLHCCENDPIRCCIRSLCHGSRTTGLPSPSSLMPHDSSLPQSSHRSPDSNTPVQSALHLQLQPSPISQPSGRWDLQDLNLNLPLCSARSPCCILSFHFYLAL